MTGAESIPLLQSRISQRADALLEQMAKLLAVQTDRLFAVLLAVEWLGGIAMAVWYSPRAWSGLESHIHPHVWTSIFLGAIIVSLPITMVVCRPGQTANRYVIACAQMLYSGLLIHLSGGRLETHFHIFGSLAFLSFYREWRVLIPATLVVAADHALRGIFWPQSVFGVEVSSNWRWMEHAAWVIFEDIFLVWACVRGTREMATLARRQAELEAANERVEAEVVEKTSKLVSVTGELVATARRAGMAEIATGVLHNVGNALNSVNVSANVAIRAVRDSEIATFVKAGKLLREHQTDLPEFLAHDQRGRQLPELFIELADCLGNEQSAILSELLVVETGIDHIKQIVSAQQQHAKSGTVRQRLSPAALFEQAIAMDSAASKADDSIEIARDFQSIAPAALDKHRIIQILLNLLSNARKSVKKSGRSDGRIVVSIRTKQDASGRTLLFQVSDNGVGIPQERICRIFSHGYTTHDHGHGFGLHHSINGAREIGGDLRTESAGEGQGATFTLELPLSDLSDAELLTTRKEVDSCTRH